MKQKRIFQIKSIAILLATVGLFSSCASVPQTGEKFKNNNSDLEIKIFSLEGPKSYYNRMSIKDESLAFYSVDVSITNLSSKEREVEFWGLSINPPAMVMVDGKEKPLMSSIIAKENEICCGILASFETFGREVGLAQTSVEWQKVKLKPGEGVARTLIYIYYKDKKPEELLYLDQETKSKISIKLK